MQSFHSSSDLIKAFFRYLVVKKRERNSNSDLSRKALFEIKQRAKRFKQVNTDLMMTA